MKKGVSPIIATVLILLIAISLGGGAYLFFKGSFEDISGTAEEEITRSGEDLLAGIRIDSVSGDKVYVRNTGGRGIESAPLQAFIEGVPIDDTASPVIVEPDEIATMTLTGITPCDGNEHALRVTSRNAEDSLRVSIDSSCNLSLV